MGLFSLQEKLVAATLRGVGTAGLEFGDKFPHVTQVTEHWVMWDTLGCFKGPCLTRKAATRLVSGGVWRKALGRKKGGVFLMPLPFFPPVRFSQLMFNTPIHRYPSLRAKGPRGCSLGLGQAAGIPERRTAVTKGL